MAYIEQCERPVHAPSIHQLEEYRNVLTSMVRSMRKGVRINPRFPDAEFMLPGSYTEWSAPDENDRVHIERDRTYSLRNRCLGNGAQKLVVLETESIFVPKQFESAPDRYKTDRRIYRFDWSGSDVYRSRADVTEIISDAISGIDVKESKKQKTVSISNIDETADPFRVSEHMLVDDKEFARLFVRTLDYKDSYFGELGISDDVAA